MSTRPFVHLHCHSHYSLLDGAASIEKLVQRAKEHGMNALAITDHGNLHGALEFYRTAKDAGVKPIVGYEAYIAPGSRFHKDADSAREASYHLTLLAQNRTGFKNLVKLASAASLEGFYFKPRIDKELLQQHGEGIVCLSGCVSSEFSRCMLRGRSPEENLDEAVSVARWFRDLFGDRYFIEVMNNGLEIQRLAMAGAVEVARRLDIPMVATCDAHYVDQDDAEAQDIMLCINTGRFRTDANRMRMDGNSYYLKKPEEMYAAFAGFEDAVAQSQAIADTIDIDLELGKRHFPAYKLPPEQRPGEYLRELCLIGLHARYAADSAMCLNGVLSDLVMQRLDRELDVISKLGFENYFLIVWDFVRYAREQNIPATARGSGVGALVCFALYLSHVCPIRFDLLFERFLDENRREAPDIDIDFCQERRGEVIRYVKEKYGEANVAQIGTFGTLQARAAIKDVGRALSVPLARVTEITNMIPKELGISLDEALQKSDDLRRVYHSDADIKELLDLALKIEGLARNVGTHAAAVVIADKPLTEYVPLCRVAGKTDVITQWAMGDVEAAGLLKMDFLGLRNLTILAKSVEIIEQTTGQKVEPHKFPLDDQATFALLCRGETKGIFQLESGGIRDLLQKMKPDHFRDIIATNALYRPGPLEGGMVDDYVAVKHGRKKAEYKHPIIKEILEETHGVMVYQEQVMRILNCLGGIALSNAYTCIKAISKKKQSIIDTNREQFLAGATKNGLSAKDAAEFWELIIKFAGYGFNKSHSTAYALIAYQTAFLKAHYSVEFMAALLTGDIPGRNFKRKDSLVEHLEDCRRMEIEIAPPNVNSSEVDFAVRDGKIMFGLSAIKGCGGAAAEALIHSRRKTGPFRSIFDFCERVDPSQCSRAAMETLIKAGAFDSLGARRSQLLAVLDRALQAGAASLADRRAGQRKLFGGFDDEEPSAATNNLPEIPELPERERLSSEKEVLGFYLSAHPLAEHEKSLSAYCSHTTVEIVELKDKTEVLLGGILSSIKVSQVRNPRPGAPSKFANFDLEDVEGSIRCILWPEDYERYSHLVEADAILVVRGAVDRSRGGEEANLIVNELVQLDGLDSRYTSGIVIRVPEEPDGLQLLGQVREVLRAYPGKCDVQLMLTLRDTSRMFVKSHTLQVEVNPQLRSRLDDLLGPHSYQLIAAAIGSNNGNRSRKRPA